ncbi:hypothetical protein PEC302110_11350 [Pectobacterium araliae]|uniref:Uncharacterized protein n=1 Tax=Pectobacterium araliae TaxID=3073862 RepID=A0AAN0KH67_9GAMM|nr:hypothetical protein PEC302110_11350 [Pectobacterium sp. MAFF 302110]
MVGRPKINATKKYHENSSALHIITATICSVGDRVTARKPDQMLIMKAIVFILKTLVKAPVK